MELITYGKLSKKYFKQISHHLSRLIPLPDYLEKIIFVDRVKHTKAIFKDFPKTIQKEFKDMFEAEPAPMALTHKDIEIIVIPVTKLNTYLKRNRKACLGLIAHELTHIHHEREGLNEFMNACFEANFNEYYNVIDALNISEKEKGKIVENLGSTAMFVIKDLFMIAELISRGLGDYVLEDYYAQFADHIKPIKFYKSIETATKEEIMDAIGFELSLLTLILPFQNYKNPLASKLIMHLQKEYEPKIQEIVKEFYGLDRLYDTEFGWSWHFQDQFINKVFKSAALLLKKSKTINLL